MLNKKRIIKHSLFNGYTRVRRNKSKTNAPVLAILATVTFALLLSFGQIKAETVQSVPDVDITAYNAISGQSEPVMTTTGSVYQEQESLLRVLAHCESSMNAHAIGDNGDSYGFFQFQKPTLEDIMSVHNGERVHLSDEQYKAIASNWEESKYWAHYSIFTLEQDWRWYNCLIKGK